MNWFKTLLGLFAKPLGAAINNGIQAGSAAVVAWSVTKGADAGVVTPIVAGLAGVLSMAVSALAATQGVQIPVINKDQTNGVRVVGSVAADRANIPAAEGPKA